MNNRTLLVVWVLALLGIGGYVYYIYGNKEGDGAASISSIGTTDSPVPQLATGGAPSTDLIGGLNSKAMLAFSIRPNGFEPIATYAREFLTHLKDTQAAQKSGIAMQIQAALDKGFLSLAEISATDPESARAIRIAGQVWGDLNELLLIFSKEKVREDLPVPVVGIAAKFNSKEGASKFRTFVDKGILLGKPSIKEQEFSFAKSANDGEYGFEIYPQGMPGAIEGTVKFNGEVLNITVGSKDTKYFDSNGSDSFIQSKAFSGLLASRSSAPAYLAYVDAKPLATFVRSLEPLMQLTSGAPDGLPEAVNPISQMLHYLDNVEGGAIVGSFDSGFVNEACVRGDLAKLNADKLGNKRASTDVFPFLIGNTTVLALRFDIPYMKYLIETQTHSLPPEVAQSFQPAFKFIDEIGAEEVGVVVNAPAGSPMPEGSLYLSTKDGTNLLQRFRTGVDAMSQGMGMPLPVQFTDSKSQQGKPLLQVMNPSGMPVVGGVVGGSTLMFSLNENSLAVAEDNLTKGQSVLQKFTLASGTPFPSLQGVSTVYLINLAPAMDTVRGFAPMLMMQPGADMLLQDPKDLDEVLNLLAGSAVFMQANSIKGSDVLCQTTGASRLGAQKG